MPCLLVNVTSFVPDVTSSDLMFHSGLLKPVIILKDVWVIATNVLTGTFDHVAAPHNLAGPFAVL